MRKLNLEATRVILGDMVTALAGRLAFENPQMVAVLLRTTRERKVISHQDATIEDLVGECP